MRVVSVPQPKWRSVIVPKNWRYIVRIANIDGSSVIIGPENIFEILTPALSHERAKSAIAAGQLRFG
jgi:hypothetical protein